MTSMPWKRAVVLIVAIALAACASAGPGGRTGVHVMPMDASQARSPESANPTSAAELAEAAFGLLAVDRPGGPDPAGAARLCLAAADVAHAAEFELEQACYRLAARSALRSGDRELYREVVERWEAVAPSHVRRTGELAVHRSIRDHLTAGGDALPVAVPAGLRRILPSEPRP